MSKTIDPSESDALLASGQEALERGDFASAVAVFDQLTRLHPRAVVAWCGRSAAFYGANDFPRALAAAQRAHELAPTDSRPFLVLAAPAFALGERALVERCGRFVRTLGRAQARDMASFWAKRLTDKDYFFEAAAAFDLFAEIVDDDLDLLFQKIDILLNAFRLEDAQKALFRAEALGAPIHNVEALRARINLARGELKEAAEAARRALAADPQLIVAYAVLADADPAAIGEDGEARLSALGGDPRLPAEKRIVAGMALGRAREKRGDIDGAFAAFSNAKALSADTLAKAGVRYNQRAIELAMRREISRPSAGAAKGVNTPKLLFVVGMPRSGSTLVDQILSRHTDVASLGESLIVPRLAERLRREEASGIALSDGVGKARPDFQAAYRSASHGAKIVVDKNLFNFQHMRLIADLDLGARFILTVRDPMDVALSIFRANFMAGHAWANRFDDIAHMMACCEFITDHWRSVFPEKFFVARHEAFVADFEPQVRALLDFCGLPFEPACLDFHEGKRAVFTQSAAQVRRPLNAEGVERWRRYERHLEVFRERLEAHRSRLRAE